jgi:thymidylate kinase
MLIAFNGIDGSGKSSQTERLLAELKAAGYPAVYVWSGSRTPLTRLFVRLVRRVLKAPTRKASEAVAPDAGTNGRAQGEAYLSSTERILKRRWVRTIWLHASLVEHMVKIWFTILPHLLRKRVVVSDRYLYDTVVSMAAMANVPPDELPALLRLPFFYRVPKPDLWFFLDVPPEVSFSRKPDIPDMLSVERRIPLYQVAARELGMQVIDATASPDEVAAAIMGRVRAALPKKVESHPTP